MRESVVTLLFAASVTFVLTGCDKASDGKGAPPPATTPNSTTPPTSGPTSAATAIEWTGTLEKQGMSIAMEGTHKLVSGGKTVVLLKSARVDLSKFEGKKVAVTGASSTTVEGNQTIVDVQEISEIR